MLKMWAAREQNKALFLYNAKPKRGKTQWTNLNADFMEIPSSWLPDLTWEDQPVMIVGLITK